MSASKSSMKTKIEFIEDTHTYLNEDGIIIPSVSALIRFKFNDQYAGVPEKILKKKAQYGSKVHEYIERFINKEFTLEELNKKKIDPDIKIAVEQFEILRKTWAFHIKDTEQIVTYKGKYAGKYDLRTIDDYIIDIKTTSEIHEEWLRWQLSLYQMAAGIKKDFGFCLWLPKGKMGKCVQINTFPEEECVQLIKDYEKAQASG